MILYTSGKSAKNLRRTDFIEELKYQLTKRIWEKMKFGEKP